ncbi:MAG: N-acetyltransferase [Candidatus Omnitrophica bacterium]|nr:N-acetyltransferase [Candidatus Omnitrophota bacterium]
MPLRKIADLKTVVGDNALFLSGSVFYLGSRAGDNLIVGHNSVIREENLIGDDFSLWSNSTIDYGCKIGDRVKVHCNCYISQFTTIEDDCFFAPGVIIANDIHPGCSLSKKCMKGATIRKGAQIGCNVTILPFVTIGEGAMVGAGSVVVHDVPKGKVVCGNPAKIIKSVSDIKCLLYPGKKYINLISSK